MQIQEAIRLLRETCALQHLVLNTEKSYAQWLVRYASFLKNPKLKSLTTPLKIEAFLTSLALSGVSVSTQNQAFNALLFLYRYVFKQELGPINSLRAKRPATLRHCPSRQEVVELLAHVADTYGYPNIYPLAHPTASRLRQSLPIRPAHVCRRAELSPAAVAPSFPRLTDTYFRV